VTFIGAVGDDTLGRAALAGLKAENLICDYLTILPGQPSGVALILVDESGQNMISVAPGANAHLDAKALDSVPEAVFSESSVFLTSLETPLETVARGLKRAKRAGLVTILNPAPATRDLLDGDLLSQVDVVTPNAGEAALLTSANSGLDDQCDEASAFCAAHKLQELGCKQVVITLGSQGCVLVDRQATRIAGRAVRAIDATAAGDAFNGALAVALSEGRSVAEAAEWANCAAAVSVTRRGAQPSLPTRREIDDFFRADAARH
jgi:ribokinase